MWVVQQDRESVVNIDSMDCIARVGEKVVVGKPVSNKTGVPMELGVYYSEERAKEVFEGLLRSLFPPACIVLKNGSLPDGFAEDAQKLNVPVMVTKTDDGVCDTKVIKALA